MASLNKVGKELVLELLNRDNHKTLTFADIVFHEPVALVTPQGIRNTKLLITATPGSNYRGSKEVMYWRLDIARIIEEADRVYPGQDITSSQDVVDLINARYELAVDFNDVIIEPIDTSVMPIEYTLRCRQGSYAYFGQVTLTLTDSLIPLEKVVKKQSIEDYLTSVAIANTYGNLHWSQSGRLPIENGPLDGNIPEQNNTELELFMGVSLSEGIQLGNDCIKDVKGVIDIAVQPNQGWDVWLGTGLQDPSRLAIGKGLADAYDVYLDIDWNNDSYTFTYKYDSVNDQYVWRCNKVGHVPIPTVYFHDKALAQQSFFRAKDFLLNLFDNKPVVTDWAILGNFNFTLRAVPKQAVYLKPFSLSLLVSVTTA